MDRFNKFDITCTLIDLIDYLNLSFSSVTIDLFRSVSVVTHKLVELHKTWMAAILKTIYTVINENKKK